MAQTVENAEAVVVTAPKEKVVTPVTVKDVENISKKVAKEVVDANAPGISYKRIDVKVTYDDHIIDFPELPEIEATQDFYLHDKVNDNWLWVHHEHQETYTSPGERIGLFAIIYLSANNVMHNFGGSIESYLIGKLIGEYGHNYFEIDDDSPFNNPSSEWELIYIPAFTPITVEL